MSLSTKSTAFFSIHINHSISQFVNNICCKAKAPQCWRSLRNHQSQCGKPSVSFCRSLWAAQPFSCYFQQSQGLSEREIWYRLAKNMLGARKMGWEKRRLCGHLRCNWPWWCRWSLRMGCRRGTCSLPRPRAPGQGSPDTRVPSSRHNESWPGPRPRPPGGDLAMSTGPRGREHRRSGPRTWPRSPAAPAGTGMGWPTWAASRES